MDLNFFKDNFKTAIDDTKNLNHNSNYNSKILNLFYDYGELCHLEYFKIFKKIMIFLQSVYQSKL